MNGLGQLTGEYQSHNGAVVPGTTPEVQYAYSEMSGGQNNIRLVSMTYPNGYVLNYNYNSGLDSTISRLSSLSDSTGVLESYLYLGLNTVVERDHPQSGINLTYIEQTGDTQYKNRGRASSLVNVSGQRIVRQQVDAESSRGGARRPNRLLEGTSGEVEPLSLAVMQGGQADPVQNPSFILIEVEDNGCRSAIEEIQPALPSFSTEGETTNAMAGQARQRSFAIGERKKDQIDQPFTSTGHVATQAEQTLAVLAESRQANCERPAIGPEELVAFVRNTFFNMVARRIAME